MRHSEHMSNYESNHVGIEGHVRTGCARQLEGPFGGISARAIATLGAVINHVGCGWLVRMGCTHQLEGSFDRLSIVAIATLVVLCLAKEHDFP